MPPRSSYDDMAILKEMAKEFEEGFNTGNVERIMRYYGDNYVDVNLRHPTQTRTERREYYSRILRKGLRIQVRPDEILIGGEWAFVRGQLRVGRQGEWTTELRYLEIARKQADGSWQVMWGMDGPVQEYDPAINS